MPLIISDHTKALFWSKVSISGEDDCWDWSAYRSASGYGKFKLRGYAVNASRVAYEIANGPIRADLVVRHSCDNPPCCNPAHLSIGTTADNVRDKIERGRMRTGDRRGAKNPRAKLSEGDVAEIRRRIASGQSDLSIAADYPVGDEMVSRIRKGLSWAVVRAEGIEPPTNWM